MLESTILGRKRLWFDQNTKKWDDSTPFIFFQHKDADKLLHAAKTQQTFVSIKRVQPKLPNIKDLVTPFMTEAIDEQMLEDKYTQQQ